MKQILTLSLSALLLLSLCACTTDSELAKIKEEQYNAGIVAGLAQGEAMYYENGKNAGYEEGHADAIQEGYDDGYDEGYESGYEYGYKSGYNNGNKNGYNDGYHDAFHNSIEYKWTDLKDYKNYEELCDYYNVDFEYMYNYFWENEEEIEEICYEYTGDEYEDWYDWATNIDILEWFFDNFDVLE